MKIEQKENIMVQIHRGISDGSLAYEALPDQIRDSYNEQRERLQFLSTCAELAELSNTSIMTQGKKAYRLIWRPYQDPSSYREVHFGKILDGWALKHSDNGALELYKEFTEFEFRNQFLSTHAPSGSGLWRYDENGVFHNGVLLEPLDEYPETVKCADTIALKVTVGGFGAGRIDGMTMSCPAKGMARSWIPHFQNDLDGTMLSITNLAVTSASESPLMMEDRSARSCLLYSTSLGYVFRD